MGKHIYYIPCLIKLNLQTKRMQCLSVVLTCVLLIIIISILVVIWYFEGPDDGGYEMLKLPMESNEVSNFLGAYLPLLLFPVLILFVLFVCYLRSRVHKKKVSEIFFGGMPTIDNDRNEKIKTMLITNEAEESETAASPFLKKTYPIAPIVSPVELNPPHLPSNASFPELKDDASVDQEQSGSTVFYQHLSYSPSFSRKQMHTESIAQTSNIERARNPKVNHASKESAL